jgi:predicted DNA-binding transcriptional regulator AlpA
MTDTRTPRDRLIRDSEVAVIYGIDRATVWRWVKTDRIRKPDVSRPRFTRWLESKVIADVQNIDKQEMAEAAS